MSTSRPAKGSTWHLTRGLQRRRLQDLVARFKLIFATVVGLTVLALLMNVVLALCGGGSEEVRAVANTCSTTYKLGFGAIVGLLGAKAM